MASNYPGSLDSLTNPGPTDSQATVSHSAQHIAANDAIEAVQAELGTDPAGSEATVVARLNAIEDGSNLTGAGVLFDSDLLDEDDMASDSATKVPSQQSVKAYSERDGVQVAASGYATIGLSNGTNASFSTVQDRAYFWPVIIPHAMTVQAFSWRQPAATTSATIRWAFYELDGPGGDPYTLIGEVGTVATPGSGVNTISSLSIALPAGRVAVAQVMQGAAGDGSYNAAVALNLSSSTSLTPIDTSWYQASVSGAFPATTGTLVRSGPVFPPLIGLQRSA